MINMHKTQSHQRHIQNYIRRELLVRICMQTIVHQSCSNLMEGVIKSCTLLTSWKRAAMFVQKNISSQTIYQISQRKCI